MTSSSDGSNFTPEFRVPPEWEPQQAIWLAWPHRHDSWPGRFDAIPDFYARWIPLIAESTPVRLLITADLLDQARGRLPDSLPLQWVDVGTNDCWIRDFGPTFVSRLSEGTIEAVDWQYNAWGGKYPPWDLDQQAAQKICQWSNVPRHVSNLCLEGGALETDGRGRLLTTSSCLVTPTRNPGWSAEQIAGELYRRLGVTEIVWLDGGSLDGDDTDGHIDQLARFIDPENIVVAVCDDPSDSNQVSLEANFRQLRLWADTTDPLVQVHRLAIPPARFIARQRVPESYCNFLRLGKERILVPTFAAPTDRPALDLIAQLSGADVTGVDCSDLVWGLGALHCASRDQPAPETPLV